MWPQWMPTCGIACARGCPTAACKNFLTCGKGPSERDGGTTPRQFYMDKEDEDSMHRRCRFLYSTSASEYSETTPRLRTSAAVSNTGDNFSKSATAGSLIDSTALSRHAALMGCGARNNVIRGRTFGNSTFDDEEVLFEARPASVDVICRGKLLDPDANVSWPDWDSPKECGSPRKRSPARNCRLSTASTSAGTSCYSPRRSSIASRSSWASMPAAEPPAPTEGKAMLASFPLPVGISAWDWPLSRHEKKSLVLMFDRQELMVQRDDFADQLCKLRSEKL